MFIFWVLVVTLRVQLDDSSIASKHYRPHHHRGAGTARQTGMKATLLLPALSQYWHQPKVDKFLLVWKEAMISWLLMERGEVKNTYSSLLPQVLELKLVIYFSFFPFL